MRRTTVSLLILLVLAQLGCGQWLQWHHAQHLEQQAGHAHACAGGAHRQPDAVTDLLTEDDPDADCRWCELALAQATAVTPPPDTVVGTWCSPDSRAPARPAIDHARAQPAPHACLARGPPSQRQQRI